MSSSPVQPSLQVERFRVPEGTLLRLTGVIDEQFPLDLFHEARGVVAIDLSAVRRVTSFGIREWIREIARIQATSLYFAQVPAHIMAQFGMVAGFGGSKGQILSFFSPYVCQRCGRERDRLFDRRTESDLACIESPPTMPCPDCGGTMEFDDVPEFYREALAGTAPLNVVPALFRVLAAGDAAARPLKMSKTVEGSVTLLWLSGALDRRASFRHAADGLEGEVVVIADQVAAADSTGVRALSRLIDSAAGAGCTVWLARCAPALIDALARAPEQLGTARLTSLEVPVSCLGCGRGSSYVVLADGLTCPHCGRPVAPELSPSLLAGLERLPRTAVPDWMPKLLERRPVGTQVSSREPFAEKYALVRQLGSGGMAEIFLARQLGPAGFDRRVAIKRILPNLAREQTFIRMFLTEARLASRLSHPNIVQIHELQETDGQYYIVMEYVEGHDLSTLLAAMKAAGSDMPVECALRIVADILAALSAAHNAKDDQGAPLRIVHRDVSPHNILVGNDGIVKLSDFGVAKAQGHIDPTRPGVLKGKISYLAPEALTNGDPDHRTDLFAVGIVLFQCLTGFHPFSRNSEYQTFQAILSDPLPPATVTRPELPARVDEVLERATARKPDERYASAELMLADIEALVGLVGRPAGPRAVADWVATLQHTTTAPSKTEATTAKVRTATIVPPEKT